MISAETDTPPHQYHTRIEQEKATKVVPKQRSSWGPLIKPIQLTIICDCSGLITSLDMVHVYIYGLPTLVEVSILVVVFFSFLFFFFFFFG